VGGGLGGGGGGGVDVELIVRGGLGAVLCCKKGSALAPSLMREILAY